ncbi:MAG: TIR domain-containing protein [Steroidobacteraceae bacterium]
MPDVFLSYCREDQPAARRFANGLEREGFTVWWDQSLSAGEAFDKVTEKALKDARAVVVLWSKTSVNSRWVRSEATQADRYGTLVPVMIEPCDRPIMFELTHTADLSGWSGDSVDPHWSSFIAGLRRSVGGAATPVSSDTTAQRIPVPATATPPARSVARRTAAWASLAAAVLAIAAGIAWYLHQSSPSPKLASINRSIAVLPFANFSADADQDHFADGLTEEILNTLARIPDLQVTARTSAFAFKGKAEDLKAVGKTLGVAHVLEGSVRHSGDQLRITAQLISTDTGFHLWSQTYDRRLADIFAIQDDIARSVAGALQVTLGVGIGGQPGMTRNIEAYESWVAARGVTFTGTQSMSHYIGLLQQVVALDPSFAQPWWDLSEAYSSALSGTPEDLGERRQQADAAFAEYRRLLPDSPRIHERLAEDSIESGQMIAAAEHYQEAANAASRLYGGKPAPVDIVGQGKTPIGFPDLVGRPRESIPLFEQAKARDPLNEVVALWLAYLYGEVGNYAAAFAEFERSEPLGQDVRLNGLALRIALGSRNRQLMLPWLDKTIENERSRGIEFSARMKQLLDRPDEALSVLRSAARDPQARRSGVLPWWLAWFGDYSTALEMLRENLLTPGSRYGWLWAIWDPGLSEVRKLPGFKQLMREIGLVDYWRKYGWTDYCKPTTGEDFECH